MDRDRNFLFWVFVVQLRTDAPAELMGPAGAWAVDLTKNLPERLLENGVLFQRDIDFIQRLVNEAVAAHDGDASATLQTLGGEMQVYASFCPSIGEIPRKEAQLPRGVWLPQKTKRHTKSGTFSVSRRQLLGLKGRVTPWLTSRYTK